VAIAGMGPMLWTSLAAHASVLQDEGPLAQAPDFEVPYFGIPVSHKTLIYLLVFGQAIGFVGALVGGNEARKRADELERLNRRMARVNGSLRRLAQKRKAGLYTPVHLQTASETMDEGISSEELKMRDELIELLKAGKRDLKAGKAQAAKSKFEGALAGIHANASALESPWKAERKALRGLGAAFQLAGEPKEALEYMEKVLAICESRSDNTGRSDALGAIADILTDLGEFEKAGSMYDLYMESVNEEDRYSDNNSTVDWGAEELEEIH